MTTTYPEPWARIFGGNEPAPIPAHARPTPPPPDPESAEATRPEDIDDCSMCMGDGAIDVCVEGTWQADACWACDGTGQRGAA